MNILIIGGLGYIGSNIALHLHNEYNITIISRSNSIPVYLIPVLDKIKIIYDDFSSENVLNNILPLNDIVIHAAGTTVPENSVANPVYDIESNVVKTIKLLQACTKNNISKFIFLSSGGVIYGNTTQNKPIKETHPTNPISSYGITKLITEKYIQLYHQLNNLPYLIFRISNVYGPFQNFKNNQGVITNWIEHVKQNKNIEIWGNENITRDYIYINDLMNAFKTGVSNNITGIFNISTGVGTSLIELAKTILDISENKVEIIKKNIERKFDVEYNVLDNSLFCNRCNWKPEISIQQGIKKIYETPS